MKLTLFKLSAWTFVCLLGLTACNDPIIAEETGEEIDQTVENMGTKIQDATEQTEDDCDKAGLKVKDTMDTTQIKADSLAEPII